jgi:hypothetical protein
MTWLDFSKIFDNSDNFIDKKSQSYDFDLTLWLAASLGKDSPVK